MSGETDRLPVQAAACIGSVLRISSGVTADRLRSEGQQTYTKLMKELRAENKLLKDRNSELENKVATLSNRLQQAGVTSGADGERLSSLDDRSGVLSTAHVENILKENARLKQLHQQHLIHPNSWDEMTMRVHSQTSQINRLSEENRALKMNLESLSESKPEFAEVLALKRALNEAEEGCRRQEELRQALLTEIESLRSKLDDTALKCLSVSKNIGTIQQAYGQSASNDSRATTYQSLDSSTNTRNAYPTVPAFQSLQSTATEPSRIKQLESAVTQLSKSNEELKKELDKKNKKLSEMEERVSLYENQCTGFQLDFERERAERLQAEAKLRELEKKTPAKQQDPSPNSIGGKHNPWDLRQAANQRATSAKTTSTAATTIPSQKVNHLTDGDNISLSSQTDIVRPKTQKLSCYKCKKDFSHKHSELKDHLSDCKGEQ